MRPPINAVRCTFAHVYDALYCGDAALLESQIAFLGGVFSLRPGALLDLGCGTGIHLAALSQAGYSATGIDVDPLMLLAARRKLPTAELVLADLRRLPFRRSYAGALCLESPLAYLLDDGDLMLALTSVRNALEDEGRLVVDVFDYPGALGTRGVAAQEAYFSTPDMQVTVLESHRYKKGNRTWTMLQEFEVDEKGEKYSFQITHQLRIRTMDDYAKAFESARFEVLQALTAYPGAPELLGRERRIILAARCKVA